ncbi:pyridoxal 5'-phosphate synthase [bacterium]|nr:pyridoxal 5'-phosphate synthase [bacterium]
MIATSLFFTNYNSSKGKEIDENPFAALTFFWKSSDYQVRIEGKLTKTPRELSKAYFSTRARESQLASMASDQSTPVASRAEIMKNLNKLTEKFKDLNELDCPENWGGYDLVPDRFIFFIYGAHRINDRLEFKLEKDSWVIQRLQP